MRLRLCTETDETAMPERPQLIIFATFQGVPKSPPRITRLNELVSRFISSSAVAVAAAAASFVLQMLMTVIVSKSFFYQCMSLFITKCLPRFFDVAVCMLVMMSF